MDYTTRDGLVITVGRIARRRLDELYLPPPVPPEREVVTWGGVTERVPVRDDPVYQRQLHRHARALWQATLAVIAPALTFTIPEPHDLAALHALGLGTGDAHLDYLRYHVAASDLQALIQAVYYQSTVTLQGVNEAITRFGYTWRGKPLTAWAVGYTPAQRGNLGADYRAAIRAGLPWAQFSALSGPEQSEIVAFWLLEDRLAWLLEQHK